MCALDAVLILASASPRRSDLLREMGVRFEAAVAGVAELDGNSAPHLSFADLAMENARRKARAVADTKPGRCVLGADTVVALEKRLLGKPASLAEAHDFLQSLSGRTHEVITGCALIDPQGETILFHEISRVTFLRLTDATIERYLAEVDVLDKAGGYALQERGEWIIARVEGSRSNVIGLPVERLEEVLGGMSWRGLRQGN